MRVDEARARALFGHLDCVGLRYVARDRVADRIRIDRTGRQQACENQ